MYRRPRTRSRPDVTASRTAQDDQACFDVMNLGDWLPALRANQARAAVRNGSRSLVFVLHGASQPLVRTTRPTKVDRQSDPVKSASILVA